jgi:hypothetical protein
MTEEGIFYARSVSHHPEQHLLDASGLKVASTSHVSVDIRGRDGRGGSRSCRRQTRDPLGSEFFRSAGNHTDVNASHTMSFMDAPARKAFF